MSGAMSGFLLRRLVQSVIAVLGTITLVFFIERLAGDPTLLMLPEGATREDVVVLRHQLGFDRPVLEQYAEYVGQIARLDLGRSLIQRVPVAEIIGSRLPYTLYLAGGALLVALGIGLPVGIVMAVRPGSRLERALIGFVLVRQSIPNLLSGLLLILPFALTLCIIAAFRVDT